MGCLFFLLGGGEGGVRGAGTGAGGGGRLFIKNPRKGGGGLPGGWGRGGARGREGVRGGLGGAGAKYFFGGPKFPPR